MIDYVLAWLGIGVLALGFFAFTAASSQKRPHPIDGPPSNRSAAQIGNFLENAFESFEQKLTARKFCVAWLLVTFTIWCVAVVTSDVTHPDIVTRLSFIAAVVSGLIGGCCLPWTAAEAADPQAAAFRSALTRQALSLPDSTEVEGH